MWRASLILLLLTAPVGAQQRRQDTPINYMPGQSYHTLFDSLQIKGTAKDTSGSFLIGGMDSYGLYVKYDNRADSINVRLTLLVAPYITGPFRAYVGLDTAIVSGTADSTTYKKISDVPEWARFGSVEVAGYMAATDSVKVTTAIHLNREYN